MDSGIHRLWVMGINKRYPLSKKEIILCSHDAYVVWDPLGLLYTLKLTHDPSKSFSFSALGKGDTSALFLIGIYI